MLVTGQLSPSLLRVALSLQFLESLSETHCCIWPGTAGGTERVPWEVLQFRRAIPFSTIQHALEQNGRMVSRPLYTIFDLMPTRRTRRRNKHIFPCLPERRKQCLLSDLE